MSANWKNGMLSGIVAAVVLIGLSTFSRPQSVQADAISAQAGSVHYTVVETDGHNLVVTDNVTNSIYFYTVDKGQAPGADLKLRASVDLNEVGKPVIKPKDVNIQK